MHENFSNFSTEEEGVMIPNRVTRPAPAKGKRAPYGHALLETDLCTSGRTPFAVRRKVHRGLILKYAAVARRRHRRGENVKPR